MNPLLPADHRYLLQHMPVGHLTKFVATYKTSFWRTRGFSGEITSISPLSERLKQAATMAGISLDGCITYSPVCCVWDATTDDDLPALVGLQGGKAAAQWSGQPVSKSPHFYIVVIVCICCVEARSSQKSHPRRAQVSPG